MSNRELAGKYFYVAEFSEADGCFVARVKEWPSIAAHGPTKEDAIEQAQLVIEECLLSLAEDEEVPPQPINGI